MIVAGLTLKFALLEVTVSDPVKSVPVTKNVFVDELPLTTLNSKDAGVTVMVGTTHLPETDTVWLVAPPPLTVMVPESVPAAVGL